MKIKFNTILKIVQQKHSAKNALFKEQREKKRTKVHPERPAYSMSSILNSLTEKKLAASCV